MSASSLNSSSTPRVLLIGIGGPTCSGKTTLTKHLLTLLTASPSSPSPSPSSTPNLSDPTSFIIHQDDFAPAESSLKWNEEVGSADWDDPDTSVDWTRLRSTLAYVKAHGRLPEDHGSHDESNPLPARPIEKSTIDKYRKAFHKELQAAYAADKGPTHVVFLDGFLLYYDDEVRNLIDVPIFLRIGKGLLEERRSRRGGYVTADGDRWEDPPLYFSHILWPSHVKAHAHLFQDGDVEVGQVLPGSPEPTPSSSTPPKEKQRRKSLCLIEAQMPPGIGEPRGIDDIVVEGCEIILSALREWREEGAGTGAKG